jgi:hypothetical protein
MIAFAVEFLAGLEVSPRQPLEWVRVRKGDHLRAQVKPYVVETAEGPVRVPFAYFAFVE